MRVPELEQAPELGLVLVQELEQAQVPEPEQALAPALGLVQVPELVLEPVQVPELELG